MPAVLPQECVGQKIGAGSFGSVYAFHTDDRAMKLFDESKVKGRALAVKVIKLRAAGGESEGLRIEKARREAKVWQQVCSKPCDSVVSLVETFMDGLRVAYLMERCELSLSEHIAKMPLLTEYQVSEMMRQMLIGLKHVHDLDVIHRDVKPDNFLVSGGLTKLGDFGLAVRSDDIWEKGNEPNELRPNPPPMVAGTAPFMSPEMLSKVRYNSKTDIWSLGCTAYSLLFGQFPHMPEEMSCAYMKDAIRKGTDGPTYAIDDRKFPKIPKGDYTGPTEAAKQFVTLALTRNADKRPSACEMLQLPFLTRELNEQEQDALPSLHSMYQRACRCGAFEQPHQPVPAPRSPRKVVRQQGWPDEKPGSLALSAGSTTAPSSLGASVRSKASSCESY